MFIHTLTESEQRAFFGLAKELIVSDGRIVEAETNAIRQIELETGINSDDIPRADASNADVIAALRGKKARTATLLELMGIACVDRDYHPLENAMIRSVAEALGVSENELLPMENWVLRQMALAAEADGFFAEEN